MDSLGFMVEAASPPGTSPPRSCGDGVATGWRAPRERPCPAKYAQLLRSALQHKHYSAVLHLMDLFACSGVVPPHAVLYSTFHDILALGATAASSSSALDGWAKYLHSFHDQVVIAREAFKRTLLRHPRAVLHVFSHRYEHRRVEDDLRPDCGFTDSGLWTPAPRGSHRAAGGSGACVRLWGFVTRGLALRKEAVNTGPDVPVPASSDNPDDVFSPPGGNPRPAARKERIADTKGAVKRKEDFGVLLLELAADMIEVDLKLNQEDPSCCLLVHSLPEGDGSFPLTKFGTTLKDLFAHIRIDSTPTRIFTQVHRILQAMVELAESDIICERTLFIEVAFELKKLPLEKFTQFVESIPTAALRIKILDHLMPMICASSVTAKEREEAPSITKVIRIYFSSTPVKPKSASSASSPGGRRPCANDDHVLRTLSAMSALVNALVEVAAAEGVSDGDRDALKSLRPQFRKLEFSVERALGESVVKRTRYSPRRKNAKAVGANEDWRTEMFAVLLDIMKASLESLT